MQEILREPYSGRSFPGYEDVDLSFAELETMVRNDRPDWKGALESVKGVYLITDTKAEKRYVGSAYGDQGVWSRWREYIENGHGGNVELCAWLGAQGGRIIAVFIFDSLFWSIEPAERPMILSLSAKNSGSAYS